ncbi:MAG TPA: acyl-CoA thioesterase domain-containing protein [Sphingobium sp.]|nr:acyl-CoA thioesterase domain-containing protein [Sphingobium sp.]
MAQVAASTAANTGKDVNAAMTDAVPDLETLTKGLVYLLDVEPAAAPGDYVGHRRPGGVGRVFGGQVVGQALMAASKTVAQDRPVHSLHCYFLRPASEDYPIDFEAAADMDGRAFSNRRVVARQQGKVIFNMAASFHHGERGPAHAAAMPQVPPPEALRDLGSLFRAGAISAGPALRRLATRPSPIEIRPVGTVQSGRFAEERSADAACWMRIGAGLLDAGQPMQRAMLAFASDLLLLSTAYRPHGLQIAGPGVVSASIDHSMWFHGDVTCGEWLLYATDSPFAGGGRGFARGHFFDRAGRLIASVAQEGLIRLRDEG